MTFNILFNLQKNYADHLDNNFNPCGSPNQDYIKKIMNEPNDVMQNRQ